MVHPLDRLESRPGNAKLALPELKKPLLPDWILQNSYLPPRGPTPVMEEVTEPWPDDVNLILQRRKPFNWGESAADRLGDLYLRTLRMPITSREARLGEKYFVVVPVGTIKEDIQQIV